MRERRRIQSANLCYAIGAWGYVIANLLLTLLVQFVPELYSKYLLQISTVVSLLVFLLPSALYLSKHEARPLFDRFRLSSVKPSIGWVIPMAVCGFFMFTSLNALVMIAAEALGVDIGIAAESNELIFGSGSTLTLLLLVGVAPAISEEFLFRGVILPAYETKGKWTAVLVSAVLFATMHGDPLALPVHLMLGIVLGLLAWHSRSVLPAMLYHCLHNSLSVLMSQASLRLLESELYQAALEQSALLTEGAVQAEETLGMYLGTYAVMAIVMGAVFCLFGWGFLRSCKRHAVAPKPDLTTNMQLRPARVPYLPLIVGVLAAIIINVLGLLPYLSV